MISAPLFRDPSFGKALGLCEPCAQKHEQREEEALRQDSSHGAGSPGRQVAQQTAPLVGLGPMTRR